MSLGERLVALRIKRGYTNRKEFAQKIGIPHTTLRNYETDSREPGHSFLIRMAQEFDVSVDYLLGIEERKSVQKGENVGWADPIISAYKGSDESTRRATCNVLRIDYIEPGEDYQNRRVMPVYVFPAAAGIPLYAEDAFEDIEFPEDRVPKGTDFGIRIRGDSMQPTIEDDTIVWVKKQTELHNGQIGVFMLHDEAVCKRFHEDKNGIRLVSDNEAYPPIEVKDYDTFRIVGRVLG